MIKKIVLFLLLFTFSLFGSTMNLALSANVSYAIEAIKKEFSLLYPDVRVKVIVSSSGKLTAQIKNGAPYDVFMSANMKYPEALYKDGLALSKPLVYAQGSLAYLSVKKRDFSQGLKLLENEAIKKIAVANPKTAPYGKATFEALENTAILDKIKEKIVYGESAAQTLSYTISAVDIGFIAKSSLYSPKLKRFKKGENWAEVDAKLYTPIEQGIVILSNAKENQDAKAFYEFILSEKAKKIFIDYGYKVQ